jgi:hypothetical protein
MAIELVAMNRAFSWMHALFAGEAPAPQHRHVVICA